MVLWGEIRWIFPVISLKKSEFKDFEDVIQYNCALSLPKIDFTVTRDTKDFKKSSLSVRQDILLQ